MASLARALQVQESSHFLKEQKNAVERHLEKLVREGKLPSSALVSIRTESVPSPFAEVPVEVRRSRPASEVVYQYDGRPVPRTSATESWARLGTSKVSFGRARWNVEDGSSIWSVADGKRLAQTPIREPTAFEANRLRKIATASAETPLVKGMRLLPVFTPARALMWGTILAMWGTAGLVMSSARALEISKAEEASEKLERVLTPYITYLHRSFEPVKSLVSVHSLRDSSDASLGPVAELARRLKAKFSSAALD